MAAVVGEKGGGVLIVLVLIGRPLTTLPSVGRSAVLNSPPRRPTPRSAILSQSHSLVYYNPIPSLPCCWTKICGIHSGDSGSILGASGATSKADFAKYGHRPRLFFAFPGSSLIFARRLEWHAMLLPSCLPERPNLRAIFLPPIYEGCLGGHSYRRDAGVKFPDNSWHSLVRISQQTTTMCCCSPGKSGEGLSPAAGSDKARHGGRRP